MAAPSSSHFSPGDLAVMKEYEIITLKYKIKSYRFFFVIASSSFKEYEIIMLIYNTKTCRLDLCFSAPEDIILHAI